MPITEHNAMEDASSHSPASVADASLHVDRTVALEKISGPPIDIDRRKSTERAATAGSSASLFANRPNSTQDDIDAHNRFLGNGGKNDTGKLFISEETRRILERMDESQVKSAREGLRRLMLQRQRSGLTSKDLGRYTRQGSFRHLGEGGSRRGRSSMVSLGGSVRSNRSSRRASLGSSGRSNGGGGDERQFSASMGALGKQLESLDEFGEESSDDDSYDEGYVGEVRVGSWSSKGSKDDERRFSTSEGRAVTIRFQPMTSRALRQLKEVEEIADETLARILKRNSAKDLSEDEGEVDEDTAKGEETEAGGIGGFWNKLAGGLTSGLMGEVAATPQPKSKSKQLVASAYFRRGKKKADKCQFLPAVALYNLALVRQREELGEDHVDCGTTLNEIGFCWLMMGERYPALTAFEEALFIRQKHFGLGAREVAETTNYVWMIVHEERQEMERLMEEDEDEEEYED